MSPGAAPIRWLIHIRRWQTVDLVPSPKSPMPRVLARGEDAGRRHAVFWRRKGDRVILYMPMVPEAVIAMLACARIGAVHRVVFGGFAAKELATRIEDAKPKLIFSASCGLEPGRIVHYKPLLEEAIKLSSVKPDACIILQRPQQRCDLVAGRDMTGRRCAAGDRREKICGLLPVLATDPLYILYSRGRWRPKRRGARQWRALVA